MESLGDDLKIGGSPVPWDGSREGISLPADGGPWAHSPFLHLAHRALCNDSSCGPESGHSRDRPESGHSRDLRGLKGGLNGHCRLHAPAPGLLCSVHRYPTFPARETDYGPMSEIMVDQVAGDADQFTA